MTVWCAKTLFELQVVKCTLRATERSDPRSRNVIMNCDYDYELLKVLLKVLWATSEG